MAVTVAGYYAVKFHVSGRRVLPIDMTVPSRRWEKNGLGVGMAPFAPHLN